MTSILKVYEIAQKEEWDSVVKSFKKWDIYYLNQYAYSFMLHGDGAPLLLVYEDGGARFCYVVMQQDIADCEGFQGQLERRRYYDLETPYGYGGPLSDNEISESSQENFARELKHYCEKNGIISQFIRFHPMLGNESLLRGKIQTRYLRDTVYIDTSSPEIIMANMDSKNRNMIRKAVKKGVEIKRENIRNYDAFLSMYIETMERNGALEYYTFKKDYFASLEGLKDHACIFYALLEGKPISGAIMLYNDRYMHYHLSGTYTEYRQYASGNLLLYEAACWASTRGIKQFHLGGGMAEDDKLFGFKKQFNKRGRLPYFVGKTVFNEKSYKYLCQKRKAIDSEFNLNNDFMIQYRR